MLDVLIYLFENFMIEDAEMQPDQATLEAELCMAGFDHGEIDKAFDWLENLSDACEEQTADSGLLTAGGSIRLFAPLELIKLNTEARGLILSLEQAGVLDAQARELIIDRVMELDMDEVELDHVKWVIMMVLCNRPGEEDTYQWAEDLVLDGVQAHLH